MQHEMWCRAVVGPDTLGRGWGRYSEKASWRGQKVWAESWKLWKTTSRKEEGSLRRETHRGGVAWCAQETPVSSGSRTETSGPSRWCLEAPSLDPDSSSPLGSNRSCPALKVLRGPPQRSLGQGWEWEARFSGDSWEPTTVPLALTLHARVCGANSSLGEMGQGSQECHMEEHRAASGGSHTQSKTLETRVLRQQPSLSLEECLWGIWMWGWRECALCQISRKSKLSQSNKNNMLLKSSSLPETSKRGHLSWFIYSSRFQWEWQAGSNHSENIIFSEAWSDTFTSMHTGLCRSTIPEDIAKNSRNLSRHHRKHPWLRTELLSKQNTIQLQKHLLGLY